MPAGPLEPVLRYLRGAAAGGSAAPTDSQLLERFAAHCDQTAFATLVRRHGALVLGVCRRVLGDWHAAEDAFQATFLVLARKAGALARPERLPQWLHGVACRTAARARVDAARRRARERRAVVPQVCGPDDALVWRDLRPVLDEEIGRLPERHRAAVVLCYLEGRTNAEAARRLGCPRGTVATLLARARERLRRRLAGRGLALPAALAAVLAREASAEAVPSVLQHSTVTAAAAFAAGPTAAAGLVSARAASLAEGVTMTLMMNKVKVAAAILLLVGLAGAGLAACGVLGNEPAPTPRPAPPLHLVTFVDGGTVAGDAPRKPAAFRTANFLVKAATPEIAEHVAQTAERVRKEQSLLWLGEALPDWKEPCPIEVKVTGGECGGATTFEFSPNGSVRNQRMHLQGPLDRLLIDTLPHEVTHTVLAHAFGKPVPRWADEGAAILSESASARRRHEKALRKLLDAGDQLALRRLLAMPDYPAENPGRVFVQGYSVTDFLVKRGGRAKVLALVKQGQAEGWDRALKSHYGYRNVEELEVAWLASVRQLPDPQPPRAEEAPVNQAAPVLRPPPQVGVRPEGRLPAGPAPRQALVKLGTDGRLTVWWRTAVYYVPRMSVTERGQPVTTYTMESRLIADNYGCEDIRVHDTKGQEITTKELRKRLKGETLVLVATDGRPVDPLHLRLLRDDTLVLVLPAAAALAEPALPAPPAVAPPLPVAPATLPPHRDFAPDRAPPRPVPGVPPPLIPPAPPPPPLIPPAAPTTPRF